MEGDPDGGGGEGDGRWWQAVHLFATRMVSSVSHELASLRGATMLMGDPLRCQHHRCTFDFLLLRNNYSVVGGRHGWRRWEGLEGLGRAWMGLIGLQ